MAQRKKKGKSRTQMAFDMDAILVALEDKFITKLTKFFAKITRSLSKKINDLEIFKKAITTENKSEILALTVLLRKYYREVGKATIKQTNIEIAEISGRTSKIKIPDLNAGSRFRAEELAIKKIKDHNQLLKEKILDSEGTLKDKKEILRKLRSTQKVFLNRHIKIVARMESISEANTKRLEAFEKSRYVKGAQFMAVLDRRTTPICRSRHLMVLKLTDPLLPSFRPPCHFGCRSLLSPVSIFEKNVDFTPLEELKVVPLTQWEYLAQKKKAA